MVKSTLIIVFLLVVTGLMAQSIPDISGEWNGTVQVPGGRNQIFYTFVQNGLAVDGFLVSKSLNGRDSLKAEIKGLIVENTLHIRSTKFIYKVGLACLAKAELAYEVVDGVEKMRGKWKGDLGLRTCPPGSSGKVEIIKLQGKPDESIAAKGTVPVSEEDQYGQALLKELKSRKYYALIIGIDQYKDKNLVHLDNPVRDATELKRILSSSYTFEEEDILFLKNPTRAMIIDAFDELAGKISDRDQLFIFYAGHGIWDEKLSQGYWLPGDASSTSKAQWLSNSTIRDYIGGINSRHTLLVTDACFSGGIFKERGASFDNSRAVVELYKMPSRKAMTSGTLTTVPDKSVFVKYLVKNLAENELPMISAGEVFQKFKIAVINNSQSGQVPQYGPIGQVGDEGGEFIFLKRD